MKTFSQPMYAEISTTTKHIIIPNFPSPCSFCEPLRPESNIHDQLAISLKFYYRTFILATHG